MAEQVKDQMHELIQICKRIAYNCPTEHISDTFFILLKLNYLKVKYISELVD